MNKTDTHKLVAAALEAEFGSYRNAELQHITANNDGQHGESLPLCLLLTKKGESHKTFEAQRLNWWRDLFNRRVTLAEAAGMLLGFSESMARHSVFMTMDLNEKIAGTNKSKLELPLPLQTRPISSGLVTAFTDMRGDVKDWRATETYRPADLIDWAKEKNFVADEVLEAWEAHNKAEAGQITHPRKTSENRQAERWEACIKVGLEMPKDTYAGYPRGIGKVANTLGITRQSLREDLDKHRARIMSK